MATNELKFDIKADASNFEANVAKATGKLKELEGQAKSVSSGFSSVSDAMKSAVQSAALGTLIAGMKNLMDAASEAEQVQAKLQAALKATGNYSEESAHAIDDWAQQMLQTKGVSDELASSLVAQGVTMGKTVEQSKRLVSAAADMAPVVGSVEAAMSLLIRASNGSTEALKRYGIQVTEAEAKSGDFEAVLKRVEQRFAGQAAAQLETYAGQVQLLAENFGNLKERLGGPLIAAANDWLTMINQLIAAHGKLERAMDLSLNAASYMDMARALADVDEKLRDLNAERDILNANSASWSSEEVSRYSDLSSEIARLEKRYAELLESMKKVQDQSKKGGGLGSINPNASSALSGGAVGVFAKTGSSAAAKSQKTVSFYGVNSRGETEFDEIKRKAAEVASAEDRLADGVNQSAAAMEAYSAEVANIAEQYEAGDTLRAIEKLQAASEGAASAEERLADGVNESAIAAEEWSAEVAASTEDAFARGVADSKAAKAAEELAAQEELAAEAAQFLYRAFEDAAYGIGDAIVAAIDGGDVGSAVSGTISNVLGDVSGNWVTKLTGSSVLGDVASDIMEATVGKLFDGSSADQFEQAIAQSWGDFLESSGAQIATSAFPSQGNSLSESEFDASGVGDMWQALAEEVTGSSNASKDSAIDLASKFDGLTTSMYTNLDVVGSLIAASQGLSDAEGDRLAAETALQSAVAFTATELSDIAMLYGRANSFIETQADLYEDLLDAAQAYYDATRGKTYTDEQGVEHKGDTSDPTFKTYEKTYKAYVQNKIDYENATKESDATLVAALEEQGDMSREDAEQIVLAGKDTNDLLGYAVQYLADIAGKEWVIDTGGGGDGGDEGSQGSQATPGNPLGSAAGRKHSGQFPSYGSAGESLNWTRNDELIVPPERYREATEYLADRGYTSGTSIVVNVSGAIGNHREIAKKINSELKTLRRNREVAA